VGIVPDPCNRPPRALSTETEPPPSSLHSLDAAGHFARPAGRCEIDLQNPCRYPEAAARRLRPWLAEVVAELAPDAETLAVRFVSDREMRRLNATFRGRDKATDVLTFPGDLRAPDVPAPRGTPPAGPLAGHLGDVAISVPTARRQARELGHDADRELRTLLLHGLLHCLGYDHETDDGSMEALETRLRERLIDPDPRR